MLNNSSENPLTPCVYGGQTACHDSPQNIQKNPLCLSGPFVFYENENLDQNGVFLYYLEHCPNYVRIIPDPYRFFKKFERFNP